MFLHPRNRDRPFHFGSFPLETLPRDARVIEQEAQHPARTTAATAPSTGLIASAADHYREIFSNFVDGTVAPAKAPVGDDLRRRVMDMKGGAYFLDASLTGICAMPASAWSGAPAAGHAFAVVVLVEHERVPELGNLAHEWTRQAVNAAADMRAAEIAAVLAGHVRYMGFQARAHFAGHALVDLEKLAVLAGIAVRKGDALEAPCIGARFSLAAITTDYALAVDPKGTNRRDLDVGRKTDAATQKMAYYHPSMMPSPDEQGSVVVDRRAAMQAAALLETPDAARKRKTAGGAVPMHYVPTPTRGAARSGPDAQPSESPYKE